MTTMSNVGDRIAKAKRQLEKCELPDGHPERDLKEALLERYEALQRGDDPEPYIMRYNAALKARNATRDAEKAQKTGE